MGRLFKRVPLDFNYPIGQIWYGNYMHIKRCFSKEYGDPYCFQCLHTARIKGIPMASHGCPDWSRYLNEVDNHLCVLFEVPTGPGYQLWENTTEGSPQSPVFETYEEMCTWAANHNISIFGDDTASKEEWMDALLINGVEYGG